MSDNISSVPRNGIYIVQGELNHVVAALRRSNRWSGGQYSQDEEQDNVLQSFGNLKEILQSTSDIRDLDTNTFLGPFLDVIRSEDTTGPITGVALSSVNKFLSYGLIDPLCESASSGIENLADAVTHARFVGTDPSSDEVVLMKILQVLRTLLLSPVGIHMTNDSVCEIMQSCFRICFEMRLSELLRRTAEQTLNDMVQLLFSRLPQFKEDSKGSGSAPHIKKMFTRAGPLARTRRSSKKPSPKPRRSSHPSHTDRASSRKTLAPGAPSDNSDTVKQDKPSEECNSSNNLGLVSEVSDVSGEPSDVVIVEKEDSEVKTDAQVEEVGSVTVAAECSEASSEKEADVDEDNSDNADGSQCPRGIDCVVEEGEDNGELSSPETSQKDEIGELEEKDSDSEACESIKVKESTEKGHSPDMSGLKSHGIISLQYPDDDVRSVEGDSVNPEGDEPVVLTEDKSNVSDSRKEDFSHPRDTSSVVGDSSHSAEESEHESHGDYINPQGVRFTVQENVKEGHSALIPYGLPCVRELLRFLITLINPHDRHNTNTMIHIGLSLLTVALESGAHNVGHYQPLMNLVKDELAKNLFSLLHCDIHVLFSLSMRVCFLLFEALRGHLKYQLEMLFTKLMEILSLEHISVPYEKREMALEYINQFFHIPFFVTELYLNFDCDLACSNVLEDLCKVLSKNAFRPGNLSSVNMLALDALLTIVTEIETHCRHGRNSEPSPTEKPKTEISGERTMSTSSERTGEDESGSEDEYAEVCPSSLGTSGFALAKKLMNMDGSHLRKKGINKTRTISETSDVSLPSLIDLRKQKHKKKMLWQGIEEFNKKPKKGIEFLQEHHLLSNPLDPDELVHFFKEFQRVDKKTIGDYVGDRRNGKVLASFVKSFDLKGTRLDEALRIFLETFRLPGESPVIALILEQFSEEFYQNNKTPYANTDAAFTLAYATIMLNVDQHNANVKQQKSMTLEEFKRNLRKVNGGIDFPPELLEDIYHSIKNEEIVMPSERTGRVKENFEWKVLLRKGTRAELQFQHAYTNAYEEDLFLLVWGPTVAALSYVYDNGMDKATVQKAITGFRKCATISAHYALSEVFDNLVISLCKFTTLLSQGEPSDNLSITFGTNMKAQLSARTAFALAHKHGEILREGWQNLLVCLFQLFKAKLLPKALTEVEDFVDQSGRISLLREEPQSVTRPDSTGILSSFYQYILSNPDTTSNRGQSAEDRHAQDQATECIKECHPELLISESKFLRAESLQELVKALVISSKPESALEANDVPFDEEAAAFFLEFLIQVALQNRDRITLLWQTLRDHLSAIVIGAQRPSFLVERSVVGLLRLAIRLLRREEISPQVLISLRIIFMMKPRVLHSCCRQISFGLHELIRTNVTNITMSRDWITIFTLLEVVGAGGKAPLVKPGPSLTMVAGEENVEEEIEEETGETYRPVKGENQSDGDRHATVQQEGNLGEAWLLINREDQSTKPVNQYDLAFCETMNKHDSRSFIKACGTLGLIIRDGAHVCRQNIFQCIHALLLFAEVSSNGSVKYRIEDSAVPSEREKQQRAVKGSRKLKKRLNSPKEPRKRLNSPVTNNALSEDELEINESTSNIYDAISLQLLDLMYSVHTNAATILGNVGWEEFQEIQKAEVRARWSSKDSIDQLPSTYRGDSASEMSLLWVKCWCPLLQGIARLCCDNRREIRMSALTVLQRALLAQDLQSLTATEWESCFNKVLFPMLAKLLEIYTEVDPLGLEETRMRAATLLCKAFLQRLNTLLKLSTFTALWMTILDFMDRYMHADNSDLLLEAIPESLKNMLLVMSTAGIFENESSMDNTSDCLKTPPSGQEANRQYSALWQVTWERIDCFLPNLRQDLIATKSPMASRASSPPVPPEPQTMETEGRPLSDDESAKTPLESAPSSPQGSAPPTLATVAPLQPQSGMNITLQPPLPALSPPRDLKIPSPSSPVGMPILLAPKPLPTVHSHPQMDLDRSKITAKDNTDLKNNGESIRNATATATETNKVVFEI